VNEEVILTHLIQAGLVRDLTMSTLAFNIAQSFPSLNHRLLSLILDKTSFNSKISIFFQDYLVGRKMKYL